MAPLAAKNGICNFRLITEGAILIKTEAFYQLWCPGFLPGKINCVEQRRSRWGTILNDGVQSWNDLKRRRSKVERRWCSEVERPWTMLFKGGITLNDDIYWWNDLERWCSKVEQHWTMMFKCGTSLNDNIFCLSGLERRCSKVFTPWTMIFISGMTLNDGVQRWNDDVQRWNDLERSYLHLERWYLWGERPWKAFF